MLKNIASLMGKKTSPSFKHLNTKNQGTHHTCGGNPGINRNSVLKKHHHYVKPFFYYLNLH